MPEPESGQEIPKSICVLFDAGWVDGLWGGVVLMRMVPLQVFLYICMRRCRGGWAAAAQAQDEKCISSK